MKPKKYSLRYWVKSVYGLSADVSRLYADAVTAFVQNDGHPEIEYSGSALEFANDLHYEIYRRGRVPNGQYFTPLPVADKLAASLAVEPGMVVLDPCCGCGNLLHAVAQRGGCGYGVEWDAGLAAACEAMQFNVKRGDFLELDGFQPEAVIINPPYGKQWTYSDIAVAFMERVAAYRVPVAAILPNGWLERHKSKKHQAVVDLYRVLEREDLPSDTFALTGCSTTRYLLAAL